MPNLLENLNEQQKLAVESSDGPVLILAGAGSGKTRVLTHRIAYILEQKKAYPEEILAVTFTNKAAGEMKERIEKLLSENSKVSWVGTFHSICIRILRRDGHHIGLNNQFTVYDRDDQLRAVKEAMDFLMIDKKAVNPNAVLSHISGAKNELVTTLQYESLAKGYFQEKVAPIYREYQKILSENQSLDFDDLIMKTVQLLENNPQVLDKYQTTFKYIHVDEYQDTNHAQYMFVKLLADKYKNICVVGDDDQSIYSWRGATIRNILEFENDYPNTKVIKLEQNYRSSKKILLASNSVISQNRKRKDKKLWTENNDGSNITVYQSLDEKDESLFVAQKIEHMIKDGEATANEIAILYRINAQSRAIEEIFLKAGIQYRIIGNVKFYDRKEIKDILAYLRIIYNPQDDISLKRIINTPGRGIGPKTVSDLQEVARARKQKIIPYLLESADNQKSGLQEFIRMYEILIKASEELNIYDLINFVIDRTGYRKSLEENKEENQDRLENIKELISIASEFVGLNPNESLQAFLERVSLYETQDEFGEGANSSITMMTIHSAKGLEFEYVFLIGMEEGIFPHNMAYSDPEQMEEERRLAYVAITRAKKHLFMSYAQSRLFFGQTKNNPVSRFVEDLPEEIVDFESFENEIGLNNFVDDGFHNVIPSGKEVKANYSYSPMNLSTGMKVQHPVFGLGKVLDFDESSVVIDFGSKGRKELLLEYAKLIPA